MALRLGLCAAVVAVAAVAEPVPDWLPDDFRAWAEEHGKSYSSEASWRRAHDVFRANGEIIDKLGSFPEDGAIYGHTRFSDMTPEEFRSKYLPREVDIAEARRGGSSAPAPSTTAPESFDWRDQGVVTPVKDQQSCGSCWAESAVANIESRWFLAQKGKLQAPVPLSVQQVVECDGHDYACYGGFPKGAYEYVLGHGGLASEDDYKYDMDGHTICLANQTFNETCGDGMCDDPPLTSYCDVTCSDSKHASVAHISSWEALSTDEDAIAAYVAEHSPVSVGVDASGSMGAVFPWLQFYKGGVANPRLCEQRVDHAVLVVGFGVDGSSKYWTIKNSWGEKWGESGYFRLIRGIGKCAVNTMATSAVIAADRQVVV